MAAWRPYASAAPTRILEIRSQGEPCEAFAHHGYNGIEGDVIAKIAAWITR